MDNGKKDRYFFFIRIEYLCIKDEQVELILFELLTYILYQLSPKLHKCPYKQRYIAGSAKCFTKHLSKLLTCILSAVKTGLQRYCTTNYSRSGVNQMWF